MLKSYLKVLGQFLLIYLLILGFTTLSPVFNSISNLYRSSADAFISTCLPKAFISFEKKYALEKNANKVEMVFTSKASWEEQLEEARKNNRTSTKIVLERNLFLLREFVTIPFIFFLCLIIVTPIPKNKKLKALLWGSILLYLFVLLRTLLMTIVYISSANLGIYSLGPGLTSLFNIIQSLSAYYITAILIWVLVAFQYTDWKNVLKRFAP